MKRSWWATHKSPKMTPENQTCECGHEIDFHIEQVNGKAVAGECFKCPCKKFKAKDNVFKLTKRCTGLCWHCKKPKNHSQQEKSSMSSQIKWKPVGTLSDKIKDKFSDIEKLQSDDGLKWILQEDVKEFIQKLKEEFPLDKINIRQVGMTRIHMLLISFHDKIDKLAGDKLT